MAPKGEDVAVNDLLLGIGAWIAPASVGTPAIANTTLAASPLSGLSDGILSNQLSVYSDPWTPLRVHYHPESSCAGPWDLVCAEENGGIHGDELEEGASHWNLEYLDPAGNE